MHHEFPIDEVRSRFPALARKEGSVQAGYLDGPGGTQVPATVIDAMNRILTEGVSNLGGGYGASTLAEATTAAGRAAMAAFYNCEPNEVVFGQNMTSLTFAVSRSLARTWNEADAIVLTSLDHDANFTPWVRAATESGVEVRIADFDPDTGLLDPNAVVELLDDKVRLVAVGLASNALGTLVDVAAITAAAHEVGALVFVDAVHAGPHRLPDVKAIGCDFLVASAYKFFGPHTGILFGSLEHLAEIDAYKVRPAPSDPPGKWETGTQSFESIAGVTAAVEYLASLGDRKGSMRERLETSYDRIGAYERSLGKRFLDGLAELSHVRLYGPPELDDRVSTFAIAVDGLQPTDVANALIDAGLYVWSGHYYAVNAMERLGVLDRGGLVRIGFVHYNTADEVDRTLKVLADLGRRGHSAN
jgi:cysteine desulfurase family protein (TIGR01976 family)